jgi:hypothetical protein
VVIAVIAIIGILALRRLPALRRAGNARSDGAWTPCEEILFPFAVFSCVRSDDCSGVSLTTEFRRRRN